LGGGLLSLHQLAAQSPYPGPGNNDEWNEHKRAENNADQQADGHQQTGRQGWKLPENKIEGNQLWIILSKSCPDQDQQQAPENQKDQSYLSPNAHNHAVTSN